MALDAIFEPMRKLILLQITKLTKKNRKFRLFKILIDCIFLKSNQKSNLTSTFKKEGCKITEKISDYDRNSKKVILKTFCFLFITLLLHSP